MTAVFRREHVVALQTRIRELEAALREYADHQAWRCAHQDRWPWDEDCQCGLVSTMARLGLADALEPYVPPDEVTAQPSPQPES